MLKLIGPWCVMPPIGAAEQLCLRLEGGADSLRLLFQLLHLDPRPNGKATSHKRLVDKKSPPDFCFMSTIGDLF